MRNSFSKKIETVFFWKKWKQNSSNKKMICHRPSINKFFFLKNINFLKLSFSVLSYLLLPLPLIAKCCYKIQQPLVGTPLLFSFSKFTYNELKSCIIPTVIDLVFWGRSSINLSSISFEMQFCCVIKSVITDWFLLSH